MAKRGLLSGAALGAGVTWLFDKQQGGRRRALIRDQLVHGRKVGGRFAGAAARDVRNRATGAVALARARIKPEPVDDRVLVERVRARIGGAVSHPSAIVVEARDSQVVLSGPVLRDEVDALLTRVRQTRGVDEVENSLEVHDRAGDVPGLQGPGKVPRPTTGVWSPTKRLGVGLAGGLAALRGLRRGGPIGKLLGAAGLGFVARAAVNRSPVRMAGLGADPKQRMDEDLGGRNTMLETGRA